VHVTKKSVGWLQEFMTNVRVKFYRSAYGMAYYRMKITPNRRK